MDEFSSVRSEKSRSNTQSFLIPNSSLPSTFFLTKKMHNIRINSSLKISFFLECLTLVYFTLFHHHQFNMHDDKKTMMILLDSLFNLISLFIQQLTVNRLNILKQTPNHIRALIVERLLLKTLSLSFLAPIQKMLIVMFLDESKNDYSIVYR